MVERALYAITPDKSSNANIGTQMGTECIQDIYDSTIITEYRQTCAQEVETSNLFPFYCATGRYAIPKNSKEIMCCREKKWDISPSIWERWWVFDSARINIWITPPLKGPPIASAFVHGDSLTLVLKLVAPESHVNQMHNNQEIFRNSFIVKK